jgi:ATP-dependent protease ClpP protease subunit
MMGRLVLICAGVLFIWQISCFGDTFTPREEGEVLHGYATQQIVDNKTVVYTEEKGLVHLDLSGYEVVRDKLGRRNNVIVISIKEDIMLEIETEAIENALVSASNKGPLFILIEIDTPGGRIDLAQRICSAITGTNACETVAFICGGRYGGAYSAGAAIAFACDKIYMAKNTAIGAAAPIVQTASGPADVKDVYGETIEEKISSFWRGYLASLAEQNHRPGLLAMAMADKDIEVIEVDEDGNHIFLESINKKADQKLIQTWSKKGSLLTLPAYDAVKCGIADKVVSSQSDVLLDKGAIQATIVVNNDAQMARKKFKRVKLKFDKLIDSLDYRYKQVELVKFRTKQLKVVRGMIADYKSLIGLAKRYPDLPVSIDVLEARLNTVEALYDSAKTKRRK